MLNPVVRKDTREDRVARLEEGIRRCSEPW
jgi:hypothetical protein